MYNFKSFLKKFRFLWLSRNSHSENTQLPTRSSSDPDEGNPKSPERGEETGVLTVQRTELRKPKMYKVIMHNDDYSTMDFVVHVLKKFFLKNDEEAHALMFKVHEQGYAVCGIYTHEVAESKTIKVNRYSKEKGHPLKCSCEPE